MYTENYQAIRPSKDHLGNKSYKLNPIQGQVYHPFILKIVEKLNNGMNPIVIFVGDTGTGKSMKALKLHEILYDQIGVFEGEFNPEQHLHYEVYDFLKQIHEMDYPQDQSVNENRQMYIFDEGGVNINSKDWQSTTNRAIDAVIQTQRMKNCLYTFVLPDIQNLDKQIRKQCDFLVYVVAQGTALVSTVDVRNDWLDGNNLRPNRFPWKWQPEMPKDKHVNSYRSKENKHKEKFVEEYLNDIEKERQEESDFTAEDLFN